MPLYDDDYEEKRKLKIGADYTVEIKIARNLKFLRKYFALINCAWEYLSEEIRAHFKENKEGFRKSLEITAGWYELVWNMRLNEWVQVSRSISFESMTEDQFETLYNRVKDILWMSYLQGVNREEFERQLMNF